MSTKEELAKLGWVLADVTNPGLYVNRNVNFVDWNARPAAPVFAEFQATTETSIKSDDE
jgi:hypothetical protein